MADEEEEAADEGDRPGPSEEEWERIGEAGEEEDAEAEADSSGARTDSDDMSTISSPVEEDKAASPIKRAKQRIEQFGGVH